MPASRIRDVSLRKDSWLGGHGLPPKEEIGSQLNFFRKKSATNLDFFASGSLLHDTETLEGLAAADPNVWQMLMDHCR